MRRTRAPVYAHTLVIPHTLSPLRTHNYRHNNNTQASELVDHLGNVMKNYDVLVIKGKGYVEVRPNGVDKGSVARRILNRHNSNTTAPLDFVLVLGDDVADEAMFGMVQNIMEQDPQPKYEGFLDNTGGASSKMKDVGVVSGISPHDPSQYAYVDDYRRQYRSFRKGNAKGAKGETSQVFSQPVGVGQRLRPPVGPAGRGGEFVRAAGAAGAAGPAKAAADVFTVTIGRKPSEASYYYDTPDDVVELLASMAKASVMWGQESKQQRSMSLSDLSQYAYRHASLGGDVGRAASGLGVEFASKALGILHGRALSLDGPGSSPASSAKDGSPEFGIGISGGAGGNGGGGDPGVLVSGGQHSSGVLDPSGTLGSVVGGSGSSRRTREQAREEEREQLRADTQKTRLAGSNSLLNIAKLAAEGSLTDASSVEALVQPPIAPIPTMEDFLDFGAEDEDEANFF